MTPMKKITALLLAVGAAPLSAADGKVPANYYMEIATESGPMTGMGQGGPGMAAGIFGAMSGMNTGGATRRLNLWLTSPQKPAGAPEAGHDIPPGQKMGSTLPLRTPSTPPRTVRKEEEEVYQEPEKPKGRILVYWGCGDKVRPGQPRVIDMAKASPAEIGKFFQGRSMARYRWAPQRAGWTNGEWPYKESGERMQVPMDASLQGKHLVHGNYSPDISFAIGERHDFLPAVDLETRGQMADSMAMKWKSMPNAVGYFTQVMGMSDEKDSEMVVWTSSESPELGWSLLHYVPSQEVRRLIKEKVVMPPGTTECRIPAGIFKKAEGAMGQFVAYGEDLSLAYPPKPDNPKAPWNPIWTVQLRNKSSTAFMPGMEMERSGPEGRNSESSGSGNDNSAGSGEGGFNPVNTLKGIFGF